MRRCEGILSLEDFTELARTALPRPIFGYIAGGADDGRCLLNNRAAFQRFSFVTRVLRDVTERSTRRSVLGQDFDYPFGIAPMGISALFAYRGDRLLARAARDANVPMIASGASLIPIEEIVAENPGCWCQAYLGGDAAEVDDALQRIRRAGVRTLVITVDVPTPSNREQEARAGFSSPLRPNFRLAWDFIVKPRWLLGVMAQSVARNGLPAFENVAHHARIPMISRHATRDIGRRGRLKWADLRRIRERWQGALVIKGILHVDDARMAREHGVDGIIISNHGGRQLDAAISPLLLIPEIKAVCGPMTLMVDSGFRRGTDVLTALALGADFVFLGRPFAYALAARGESGVRHAIELLRREIDAVLAMLGHRSVDTLDPSCLRQTDVRAN
ncbi:MAG: alpha-hydroxy acid oxidase [Steroidobacteraceae bacterium]